MNLRDVIKNTSKQEKDCLLVILNEKPDAKFFAQDFENNTLFGYSTNKIHHEFNKWQFNNGGNCFHYCELQTLATDHATTILTRDEMLELLKGDQPDYTLDNLPEKWFIEFSSDFDANLFLKITGITAGVFKYYGIDKDLIFSNYISKFDGFVNVTHLFLKQPEQQAPESSQAEPKAEQPDVIEINGKRYRTIDTGGKFESGDLVMHAKGSIIAKFIGYDDDKIVLKHNDNMWSTHIPVVKLEEVKIWHYAIYKGFDNCLYASSFFESKDSVTDQIGEKDILEYRTFERERDPEL